MSHGLGRAGDKCRMNYVECDCGVKSVISTVCMWLGHFKSVGLRRGAVKCIVCTFVKNLKQSINSFTKKMLVDFLSEMIPNNHGRKKCVKDMKHHVLLLIYKSNVRQLPTTLNSR